VPGGWLGSQLAADAGQWRLPLTTTVTDDLLRAAAALGAEQVAADPLQDHPAVSAETQAMIAEVARRLAGVPGLVVLGGFPVDDPELAKAAYWVLGLLLGRPVPQNLHGDFFIRVEDTGPDPTLPGPQRHRLGEELPFHVDPCTDLIGLLCIRQADVGGLSRLVSTIALHNILLDEHPDLLQVLYEPLPLMMPPLGLPDGPVVGSVGQLPVFSCTNGQFAGRYVARRYVEETQRFPHAPRLTERQVAAMDAVDEVLSRPGMALDMELGAGDLQLINNFSVLHARTAYHSDATGNHRLLLRMWLAYADSPALPEAYTTLFASTAPGTYRGGVLRTQDWQDRFGIPLRAAAG
jgi:hypothetical protein